MKANFTRSLDLVLKTEGGFVRNQHDDGGATNKGITLGTLQDAGTDVDGDGDVDVADLKKLTTPLAGRIYRARYWSTVHGDELPAGLDYMLFDTAVQHGPTRARKYLQMALGVTSDGVLGPKTFAALKLADVARIIRAVSFYRLNLYRGHADFQHFKNGWLRRLDEVTAQALRWA